MRNGYEVRRRSKEFMISLIARALQRRQLVFPIDNLAAYSAAPFEFIAQERKGAEP
jgi:hypothetical protein